MRFPEVLRALLITTLAMPTVTYNYLRYNIQGASKFSYVVLTKIYKTTTIVCLAARIIQAEQLPLRGCVLIHTSGLGFGRRESGSYHVERGQKVDF